MGTILFLCRKRGRGWSVIGKIEEIGYKRPESIIGRVRAEPLSGSLRSIIKPYLNEPGRLFGGYVHHYARHHWYQLVFHASGSEQMEKNFIDARGRYDLFGRYTKESFLYDLPREDYQNDRIDCRQGAALEKKLARGLPKIEADLKERLRRRKLGIDIPVCRMLMEE